MQPKVALLIFSISIIWLIYYDNKQNNYSRASWIALIWVLIVGSRPISLWVYSLGGGLLTRTTATIVEGSPIDRSIYLALIVSNLYILLKRNVDWAIITKKNRPIIIYFIYCGISILWSDYPIVSLKRLIKTLGNAVIVLVALTEKNPTETSISLIKRCALILLPLSVMFIKYYPQLGRAYNKLGEGSYSGVSYNKNGLGYLCMISGIFLIYDFLNKIKYRKKLINSKKDYLIELILIGMTFWLINKSNSATSTICYIIGSILIIALNINFIKKSIQNIGFIIFILILFILSLITIGLENILSTYLEQLGRQDTFWGRVELWKILLQYKTNPWIGSGYDSFWLGDRLKQLWEIYWWKPNQAHNGYIEIYLNTGLFGIFLIAIVILSNFNKMLKELVNNFEFSKLRISLLTVIILYNITEASFKGLHLVWFAFLLITFEYKPYRFKN